MKDPYGEDELFRVLKEMISLEDDLETLKHSLALKSDFNLDDCFKLFDPQSTSSISSLRQLEETYLHYQIYPSR